MTEDKRNDLGEMLRQRRLIIPMTLKELAAKSGVSASHLGRIEGGERFPSARILRKLAEPLGFGEDELFTFAGFLSHQPSKGVERPNVGRLDPYAAAVLSQEPVEIQRSVVAILLILKGMARGVLKL